MVEHFKEHRTLNEGTTFWSFLMMHYSNEDVKYADYDKDMRLPFKSHDNSSHLLNFSFIHFSNTAKISYTFDKTLKTYKIFNDHEFQSSYLSNIWQPPKSC